MAIPLMKTAKTQTKVDPSPSRSFATSSNTLASALTTILQKASFSPIPRRHAGLFERDLRPGAVLLSQPRLPRAPRGDAVHAREAVNRFGIENLKEGRSSS